MPSRSVVFPRVESKGSRSENVGLSIRRTMLICPDFHQVPNH